MIKKCIVHKLLDMQGFSISNHIWDCHNVPMSCKSLQIPNRLYGCLLNKYALNEKFPIN
jgi:hypothetical protein